MRALSVSQKKKVMAALDRGVKDLAIAKTLVVPVEHVREIRIAAGLTRDQVTEKRYAHWKRMLEEGYSLAHIGTLYCVKPNSVKLMLWHKFRFSLVEAKKKSADGRLEMQIKMQESKSGKAAQYSW